MKEPCIGEKPCSAADSRPQQQQARSASHPLLLRLGLGALPDMRLAQGDVSMLALHESYAQAAGQGGAAGLKITQWRCAARLCSALPLPSAHHHYRPAHDGVHMVDVGTRRPGRRHAPTLITQCSKVQQLRCQQAGACTPFAWKGKIYTSQWLALGPGQERAALGRLDLESGSVELVYRCVVVPRCLRACMMPAVCMCGVENGLPKAFPLLPPDAAGRHAACMHASVWARCR